MMVGLCLGQDSQHQGRTLAEDVGVQNWRCAPPLAEKPHACHKAACRHYFAA